MVVHFPDTDRRVKIKQDDYVQLRRIVTGLNERVVWERLGAGETVADICAPLPDEFHAWVQRVADRLTGDCEAILRAAEEELKTIVLKLPIEWSRKDYAKHAKASKHTSVLFQMLDGRDPRPGVWRTIRPSGAVSMTNHGEDVA